VSRLLRPLEIAGLIVIGPDPDDGRAKAIRLTDTGYDTRRRAAAGWSAAQVEMETSLGNGRLAALRFALDDAYSHL
jgi:DNA-binding MarR family transcriptional regulator